MKFLDWEIWILRLFDILIKGIGFVVIVDGNMLFVGKIVSLKFFLNCEKI